jgi:hypothetical protein
MKKSQTKSRLQADIYSYLDTQHFLAQRDNKTVRGLGDKIFSSSEATDCSRAIAYRMLGIKPNTEEVDIHKVLLLRDGDYHCQTVQDLFSKVGITYNKERGVTKKLRKGNITIVLSGHTDFCLKRLGKEYVIECKGINHWNWKTINKTRETPQKYINQLQMYMYLLNIPRGYVIIKNKNTSELYFDFQKFNPHLVAALISKFFDIQDKVNRRVLPAPEYEEGSRECGWCDWSKKCKGKL